MVMYSFQYYLYVYYVNIKFFKIIFSVYLVLVYHKYANTGP